MDGVSFSLRGVTGHLGVTQKASPAGFPAVHQRQISHVKNSNVAAQSMCKAVDAKPRPNAEAGSRDLSPFSETGSKALQ